MGNLTTSFPGSSPTRPPWQESGPWERDWELDFTIAPFTAISRKVVG